MVDSNSIVTRISSSLAHDIHAFSDIIKFANAIIVDKSINKGDHSLCNKLKKSRKLVTFDILNNISDHVTLVKLMDSLGNINHAVSVVGKFIFDSNYEKALPLTIESLNFFPVLMKIKPSQSPKKVYYAVINVNPK